jgi:putative transposase
MSDGLGELSTVGARSVLRRYSDAWFQAAKRRRAGQQDAGFPRRKRALVPVRFYHGTFLIDGRRVRLPVAKGHPELWVRLARPLPYPPEQVRAATLLAEGGRLWLAVTAAVPVQHQDHDLDPDRVAGVDLGIIHPYAVVTEQAGLLVSGRAIRAENWLHLLGSATRVDAVSDHCAGVLGWMFLLLWNTFSGSYLAFTSASRRYVASP